MRQIRWQIRLRCMCLVCSALALTACSFNQTSQPEQATLYQRLGQQQGLSDIVDRLLQLALADARIKDSFKDTNMQRLRRLLLEQFCELSAGPCTYSGDPMQEVHQGLAITEVQFNAVVEDLQMAMAQMQVPWRAQNQLLAKLAALQPLIVHKNAISAPL